jgi:hypothetical protein
MMKMAGMETALSNAPDGPLAAILDRAELDDIVCYGLAAQSAAGYSLPPVKRDDDSDSEMTVRTRMQPGKLTVRVIVRIRTTDAALEVDLGAVYSIPDVLDHPPQFIARFIADSAIPTIYPFIRELIADASRRVSGERYLMASLEPPRVSDTVLNRMTDDLARLQQEVIAESHSGGTSE